MYPAHWFLTSRTGALLRVVSPVVPSEPGDGHGSLDLRGKAGTPNCGEEDVNADGLLDLVCHFRTQKAGFQAGDTEGILTGKTVDGVLIQGTDSINIVPPK